MCKYCENSSVLGTKQIFTKNLKICGVDVFCFGAFITLEGYTYKHDPQLYVYIDAGDRDLWSRSFDIVNCPFCGRELESDRPKVNKKECPVKDIPAFLDQLDNDDRNHLKKEDRE